MEKPKKAGKIAVSGVSRWRPLGMFKGQYSTGDGLKIDFVGNRFLTRVDPTGWKITIFGTMFKTAVNNPQANQALPSTVNAGMLRGLSMVAGCDSEVHCFCDGNDAPSSRIGRTVFPFATFSGRAVSMVQDWTNTRLDALTRCESAESGSVTTAGSLVTFNLVLSGVVARNIILLLVLLVILLPCGAGG